MGIQEAAEAVRDRGPVLDMEFIKHSTGCGLARMAREGFTHSHIRFRLHLPKLSTLIKYLCLKFAGHVVRSHDGGPGALAKAALTGAFLPEATAPTDVDNHTCDHYYSALSDLTVRTSEKRSACIRGGHP